jgi:PAS domain S-box-containing protein
MATGLVTYVSREVETILGYPAEDWLTRPDFAIESVEPQDQALVNDNSRRLMEGGEPRAIEYRMRAADGRLVWIRDITCIEFEDGVAVECYGLFFDVTDLRTARKATSDFAGRLIQAQEEERRRVARELHDEIGQRIALTAVQIDGLRLEREVEQPELAQRLGHVWDAIENVAQSVRTVAHTLHSTHLQHLGLAAAVRELCAEVAAHTQIRCETDIPEDSCSCTDESAVSLALFRVAQESLHNAVHHSDAKHIRISLHTLGESCMLEVADDGRGFDLASAQNDGLGLISMRERIRSVDGELVVLSAVGKGTLIRASARCPGEHTAVQAFS